MDWKCTLVIGQDGVRREQGVADLAIEWEVYRYMRRHVAAYIAMLREIARRRRAANKESVA